MGRLNKSSVQNSPDWVRGDRAAALGKCATMGENLRVCLNLRRLEGLQVRLASITKWLAELVLGVMSQFHNKFHNIIQWEPTRARSNGFGGWVGGVLQVAVVGGLMTAIASPAAFAANDSQDDFRRCTSTLAKLDLPQEEVLYACSRSLQPEHLWKCVERVNRKGYAPDAALNACRQVREPQAMAACVVGIRDRLKDSVADEVLDNCRRSLLPVRYADCVVGTHRGEASLTPIAAMTACNDADYFPREVDPTFIPYSTAQPSILLPETTPLPAPVPDSGVSVPTPQPRPAAPATGPVRALY